MGPAVAAPPQRVVLLTAWLLWRASAVELPPCNWTSCPICLPEAKALGSNLSVWGPDGQLYRTAFRLARAEAFWDSQSNVQTILGILLREKLGINVDYTETFDEYHSMLAMLNCAGYSSYECTEQPRTLSAGIRLQSDGAKRWPDPLPDVFASVEIWPGALQPAELGITMQAFERGSIVGYGSVGFLIKEHLWVLPEATQRAWSAGAGALANHLLWRTDRVAEFVSTPRAYVEAGVRPELAGCPGDEGLPALLEDGFAALEKLGFKCVGSWWLAPACAALGDRWMDDCAAVLDDDWGYPKPQLFHALAASGMRVAKLTLGYDNFYEVLMRRQFNSSFLWWDTDTQFLPLKPVSVQFERRLETRSIIVQKVAWANAAKASEQIDFLLRSIAITNEHLDEMLERTSQATHDGFSAASYPAFHQKLACDWLRGNEEVWSAWLPSASSCSRGEVFQQDAGVCQACPAGTAFLEDVNGPLCQACLPGRAQASEGATSCSPCPAGSFAAAAGSVRCSRCPTGRYSGGGGSSACLSCAAGKARPTLWTSLRQVELADGTVSWYPTDGASNISECGCTEGSRLDDADAQCLPCGIGLTCPGGPRFQVQLGFFAAQHAEGLSMYQCFADTSRCPGGDVGSCAFGRTGIACSRCQEDMSPGRGGTCVACGGPDVVPAICMSLSAVLVLVAVYAFSTQANLSHMSGPVQLFGGGLTQLAGTLQIMSVIARTSVAWPTPAAEVLGFCAELVFSVEDLMRLNCLTTMGSVEVFAVKILGVWGAVGTLFLLHTLRCIYQQKWSKTPFIASSGLIFQTFFISIIALATAPLQCNRHPNGRWTTVRYDSVVCWEGGEHSWMLVFSVLALAAPLGFLTHVAFLLYKYPAWIRSGDVDFFNTYAFLFARIKPEARWFILVNLLRGLVVAMAPSIPSGFWQLFVLCALFLAVACLVLHRSPWRTPLANGAELLSMFGFVGVLFMAMPFLEDGRTKTSEIITGGMVVVFLPCPVLAAWALYKRVASCRKQKRFRHFLCHNKKSAGALARLLKVCLTDSMGQDRVFLDSDNLGDLQTLFAYVRDDVETLVILCSNQVVYSVWCLGEMATAQMHRVPMFCVMLADFASPSDRFIADIAKIVSMEELVKHGFSSAVVQEALRGLAEAPAAALPPRLELGTLTLAVDTLRGRQFLQDRFRSRADSMGVSSSRKSVIPVPSGGPTSNDTRQTHIVCDESSSEAQCTALVLVQMMCTLLADTPSRCPRVFREGAEDVGVDGKLILLCTQNCFSKAMYLSHLAKFAQHGVTLVVPVAVGADFELPTPSFYSSLARTVLLISSLAGSGNTRHAKVAAYSPELLHDYINAIFSKICLNFSILGSKSILDVEVRGIVACTADMARLRLAGLDLKGSSEKMERFVADAQASSLSVERTVSGGEVHHI